MIKIADASFNEAFSYWFFKINLFIILLENLLKWLGFLLTTFCIIQFFICEDDDIDCMIYMTVWFVYVSSMEFYQKYLSCYIQLLYIGIVLHFIKLSEFMIRKMVNRLRLINNLKFKKMRNKLIIQIRHIINLNNLIWSNSLNIKIVCCQERGYELFVI